MADFTKFKNVNGDDLVLQDSRVDAISEKVEGIETGAEVNKIESISIDNTELDIYNKNVTIELGDGLEFVGNELCARTGTGGIVIDGAGNIDIICKSPLRNVCGNYPGVELEYDNTLTKIDYSDDPQQTDEKLSVKNPVPTPVADHSDVGKVLTVQQASNPNDPDEIVWAAPQGGLPSYTQSDAGKVLAVNQNGNGVEWINVGGSSIELPALPTENGTGGGLDETMTRVILIGDCNYDDHFTLKWEYDFNVLT